MTPDSVHRRRPRYPGRHPRRFEDKYKEHNPQAYPETVAKVLASGKTPAGTHVPIMVPEILEVLQPRPGDFAVDCTLGYGGHARAILARLAPGGHLLGLDVDPTELSRTERRLHDAGFTGEQLTVMKSNFAGVSAAIGKTGRGGADVILSDLGVSSMQLDNPQRGFSTKLDGPLDMRMNPSRGISAAQWLLKVSPAKLAAIFEDNADEPHAAIIAPLLAGKSFSTTQDLAAAVRQATTTIPEEDREISVRRVFQAIRIEVNDEFSALEALLRSLPQCLKPGGRVAILTFHSGEDRRVKKAFQLGVRIGIYTGVARRVLRASAEEKRANPRSVPAKLRWAVRS